ncbi:DUF362 domain-containing protein [bacterium]
MTTDKKTRVAIRSTKGGIKAAAEEIFSAFVSESLIRGDEVFVKVNGIDFKPFCYTDPDVLDAVLGVLNDLGARNISVMENCTQGNFTRLVFRETGYNEVCRRHGAKPLYLDEGKRIKVHLETMGYDVGVNTRLLPIVLEPEAATYINIPKLKCHSMSTLTLGIKNQFGLIDQADRIRDHNYKIHAKFVDIFRVFTPTLTIIDAIHAVYNGHYPAEAHLAESLDRLDILVGGTDMMAVDTVGAKILGYSVDEVEHLRLSREAGLGCGDFEVIEIDGPMPPEKKYHYDILMDFPPELKIIRGKEMNCQEGCARNTETLIQVLYRDHSGTGNFTVIMGKGFDKEEISSIEGPVHLAGMCAVDELEDIVSARPGNARVTKSYGCNNLAASVDGITKHMGVSMHSMTPHPVATLFTLLNAKLHGTRARIPKMI